MFLSGSYATLQIKTRIAGGQSTKLILLKKSLSKQINFYASAHKVNTEKHFRSTSFKFNKDDI